MNRGLIAFGFFLATLFSGVTGASAQWKTACDKKRCQLFRQIAKKDKTVLARLFFQNFPPGGAAAAKDKAAGKTRIIGIAMLPLGLYIPAGVGVEIDKKLTFKADLVDCTAKEGCRAAFDLQPATLSAMKRGGTISVKIIDGRSRRTISFNFSLIGFTSAYDGFVKKL